MEIPPFTFCSRTTLAITCGSGSSDYLSTCGGPHTCDLSLGEGPSTAQPTGGKGAPLTAHQPTLNLQRSRRSAHAMGGTYPDVMPLDHFTAALGGSGAAAVTVRSLPSDKARAAHTTKLASPLSPSHPIALDKTHMLDKFPEIIIVTRGLGVWGRGKVHYHSDPPNTLGSIGALLLPDVTIVSFSQSHFASLGLLHRIRRRSPSFYHRNASVIPSMMCIYRGLALAEEEDGAKANRRSQLGKAGDSVWRLPSSLCPAHPVADLITLHFLL